MKTQPNSQNTKSKHEEHSVTEEEKRKAFVGLIAQIIVDISFKDYQEEKSRQESK